MLRYTELFYIEIVTGKRKGPLATLLRGLLYFFSLIYKGATSLRNKAFDNGWVRCYYAPVPVVVSVGNIVTGGTGKTPLVLKLAKDLDRNAKLAILTRGYRSPAERLKKPITLSRGEGPSYPSSYCGDEPYLLSKNLPHALMFVGKDRQTGSIMASKLHAKVVLLDDGMQYRSLARDFEVVVMDAMDPFGQEYLLPRGFLRERLEGLSRASLIVLNHVKDKQLYLSAKHKLARYTEVPVIAMHPKFLAFKTMAGEEISLKEKKAGVFCGIAKPLHFFELLENQEVQVVDRFLCPDHIIPASKELHKFAERCRQEGAEYLLCTEKDSVKLTETAFTCPLPIIWLQMELEIIEGQEHWEAFLNKIREKIDEDVLISTLS